MVKKFSNKDDEISSNKYENIINEKKKSKTITQFNNRILSKKFKEQKQEDKDKSQNQNLNSVIPLQSMNK